MRNARRPTAASDFTRVRKHQAGVYGHGGPKYLAYIGGPGGEYRLLEVLFCEYAMRGSPRPHPALLVFSNTKWTYAVTVDISIVGILEGPGGEYRLSEVPFGEIRNARRPAAASDVDRVPKHEVVIHDRDGHVYEA